MLMWTATIAMKTIKVFQFESSQAQRRIHTTMRSIRLLVLALLASGAALLVHLYIQSFLCVRPSMSSASVGDVQLTPSPLVDALARELLLRTSHSARLPLADACRSELAQLLLLMQTSVDAAPTHDEWSALLRGALGVESLDTALHRLQLTLRVFDKLGSVRSPASAARLASLLDSFVASEETADVVDSTASSASSEPFANGDVTFFSRSVVMHRAAQGRTLPLNDRFTMVVPS